VADNSSNWQAWRELITTITFSLKIYAVSRGKGGIVNGQCQLGSRVPRSQTQWCQTMQT